MNTNRRSFDSRIYCLAMRARHVFEYVAPGDAPGLQEGRIVQGNVLIWAGDTLTYRLESSLSLAEARRVAESLH